MRKPLIERLPPDSPHLARFDSVVETADQWIARLNEPKETRRARRRCWRRYTEWCALKRAELREQLETVGADLVVPERVHEGYQADPARVTTELITEFAQYLCTVKRYAVSTCLQAIRTVELAAESAGVTVSVAPAHRVVKRWGETVAAIEADRVASQRASATEAARRAGFP